MNKLTTYEKSVIALFNMILLAIVFNLVNLNIATIIAKFFETINGSFQNLL